VKRTELKRYGARRTFRCRHCGASFERLESQVRLRGAGKYCSRECIKAAGLQQRMATCKQCGTRYERAPQHINRLNAGKFCSRDCWRQWNRDHPPNLGRKKENPLVVPLTCISCGRSFTRPRAWVRRNTKNVYCSRECQTDGRIRPGSTHHRGRGWKKLAEEIRVRDGRRCVRCGVAEEPNRRHSVDHIIPWLLLRETPEVANDPENLATLCSPCHGIKTTKIEPRLMKGDFLALQEFYGREVMKAAMKRIPVAEANR
jgi:5-methylcytosine-specific restriction endonuclease McrA